MNYKKLLSLLMAVVMTFSLSVSVSADEADTVEVTGNEIVILYSNDTHCHLEDGVGIAGFAGYADEMKALYGEENVTLVDAGDFIQGDAVGALSTGQFIIDAYNAAGYDIVTLGNHEFDYQVPRLFELMEQLDATVVSSNFVEVATGESVYDAYTIVEYGDYSVAFVGIATPESYFKSTPSYFMDDEGNLVYSFCEGNDGQDMYDNIQASIDAAKAEGADYVIALAHLGIEETSEPYRSTDVIANTTGFDVVIDGHSHNYIEADIYTDAEGNDVILTQMGEYYDYLGKMIIDPVADTITCVAVSPEEVTTQNEDVLAALEIINTELDPLLDEIVATSDVPLAVNDPVTGERLIRNSETNLGDLVADAYRTMLDTDVAIVNGGGIRADIEAGDISFRQVIAVHPFGNQGTSVYATGQEILDALEMSVMNYPGELGGFLQISGMTYTLDATIPSSVVTDDMGSFVEVAGEYRVTDLMIGDEPVDLEGTYSVASHDYLLLSGGDGLTMFMDNETIKTLFMVDNEVLINFIANHLDGVVGEEYADVYGAGRITVIEPALTTTYQVPEDAWYFDAAAYVLENGLMGSTSADETIFDGDVVADRGAVFEALYILEGSPEVTEAASFTDLEDSAYATSAAWAESVGLTYGVGDGLYAGDADVTRAEVATILARYMDMKLMALTEGDLTTFDDVDEIPDWAVDGMTVAVGTGLMVGEYTLGAEEGSLSSTSYMNPTENVTSAEIAQILLNLAGIAAE